MLCNMVKVIAQKVDFYVTLINFAIILQKNEIVVIVGEFNGALGCIVEDRCNSGNLCNSGNSCNLT